VLELAGAILWAPSEKSWVEFISNGGKRVVGASFLMSPGSGTGLQRKGLLEEVSAKDFPTERRVERGVLA
jgi:hypothetical protein